MKLFHTENGVREVYVQLTDLLYLICNAYFMNVPNFVYEAVKQIPPIISDLHRSSFISFKRDEEVEFFKKLDFILDYDKYKVMSEEQLRAEKQKLVDRLKGLIKEGNLGTNDSWTEVGRIEYTKSELDKIISINAGHMHIQFPTFVNNNN